MDNQYSKIKHLEMIQNIISRMANNSFKLKEWTITLVVAVFALTYNEDFYNKGRLILIVLLPIFVMWVLDSYYLQNERQYRKLYKLVCDKDLNNYELNANDKNLDINKDNIVSVMFSTSEWPLYVVLGVASVILVMIK